jgi:hypothetical protein
MRSRFPATAAFILALATATVVHAQDDAGFLHLANDFYAGPDRAVPDSRRSDLVLIPALAKMAAPPEIVSTPLRAALVTPGSDAWSAASQWAAAAPQQAVLDAIRTVGEPLSVSRRFAFLLPYGEQAASKDAREAGFVIRVGEPPVLASAQFEYLRTLNNVASLVNVEATRLASDGKANDAATLLVRWTLFSRQIADREFFDEKRWGVRNAVAGLERLRDLVNEYSEQFTGSGLAEVIASLSEDYIGAERLQIPRADLLAGKQIVSRAFAERQGPSEAFGATMARASAGDRPLRLFGEASRWQDLATKHGNTFETGDALDAVFGDWEYRWRLPEFDRGRKQTTDFDRLSKDKFAAVYLITEGIQEMFDLRQRLRAEVEGTRLSLGVMGYKLDNGVFPRSLAGIRPRYVKSIGVDPYNEKREEFHFFVPIRDQPRGERELPKRHEIAVGIPVGSQFRGSGFGAEDGGLSLDPETGINDKDLVEMKSMLATLEADINAAQAQIDQYQARLSQVPAEQRATAEASITMMRIGVVFMQTVSNAPEVRELAAASSAASIPVERRKELAQSLQARMVAAKEKYLASLSDEARASLQALIARPRDVIGTSLDDTDFVLYSAGVDQERQWARAVGEGAPDMLFWPPALSIFRDRFTTMKGDVATVTDKLLWITPSTRGPQTGPGR